MIAEFKKLGCKISIDDFGTGYSSFEYLMNIPLTELKLDRSFIKNIHLSVDTDIQDIEVWADYNMLEKIGLPYLLPH